MTGFLKRERKKERERREKGSKEKRKDGGNEREREKDCIAKEIEFGGFCFLGEILFFVVWYIYHL